MVDTPGQKKIQLLDPNHLTEEYSEKIVNAIEKDNSIEENMTDFERINDKIKFQAFEKVTIGRAVPREKLYEDEEKAQDVAKELFEKEVERAKEEIEEIEKLKVSKVGKVWEIRKK